jgi:hypothetical protein
VLLDEVDQILECWVGVRLGFGIGTTSSAMRKEERWFGLLVVKEVGYQHRRLVGQGLRLWWVKVQFREYGRHDRLRLLV